MPTRFGHVNLIARDWRRLARFYIDVFGCTPVPPERNLTEEWLGRSVGLPGATLRGQHLRLPGFGDDGPTLEIFQYDTMPDRAASPPANAPGFGHIAFQIDDVPAMSERVVAAGGSALGELVDVQIAGAGRIVFQYLRDPEGNIVEIQRWFRVSE